MTNMDETCLAYMISRADDEKRLDMFEATLREAISSAGMEYDLIVYAMTDASFKRAYDVMDDLPESFELYKTDGNVGQHMVMNEMIDKAEEDCYDYLLRLDDDVKFLTKRWLVKMIEAAELLGPNFIISPSVVGLQYPPETTPQIEQDGVKFRVVMGALGGICRLHYVETLCNPIFPYVSDVRLPLGFGDATGIGEWCGQAISQHQMQIWMVYLDTVRVKHAKGTSKQVKDNPEYHDNHDLFQKIPYIPVWHDDD